MAPCGWAIFRCCRITAKSSFTAMHTECHHPKSRVVRQGRPNLLILTVNRPHGSPEYLPAQVVGASRCVSSAQALPSARNPSCPSLRSKRDDSRLALHVSVFQWMGYFQLSFLLSTASLVFVSTLGIASHYTHETYPAILSGHFLASM